MAHIESNKTSSAIFGGFADMGWVRETCAHVIDWFKQCANFDWGDVVSGAASFLTDTGVAAIKGIKAVVKGDWGKIFNYFKKNPGRALGQTAAIAGVALAGVAIGVVVFSGVTALGALIGAPIAAGLTTLGVSGGIAGFVGSLSGIGILGGILGGLNYLFHNPVGACLQWVVSGALYLYDFDFNLSDEELDKQAEAAKTQIFGSAGTVAGYALADVVCGYLPSVALVKLNLTTAHRCWEVIGEMDKQELLAGITSLLGSITNYANSLVFNAVFKNARKAAQAWAQDPNARKLLDAVHPGFSKTFQELGKVQETKNTVADLTGFGVTSSGKAVSLVQPEVKVRKEPWTLRTHVEERIQKIQDPNKKAFVSNLYNAALNSCTNQLLCLSFSV